MISEAQLSMRQNYINGGPGVVISGFVWILAAIVGMVSGFQPSMICFFLGGMLIHPASVFVSRKINPVRPLADRKLVQLSLLTLPILFGGLYLAYVMSLRNPEIFYPVMAVAIGLRYLIFRYVYGANTFFLLGFLLIAAGGVAYLLQPNIFLLPQAVGVIELLFGVLLTNQKRV